MKTLHVLISRALASKLKFLHEHLTVVTLLQPNTQDGTIEENGVLRGF